MNIQTDPAETQDSGSPSSATQTAYLTLRDMIVTGELKPGEKLKIEALRSRLQTGASPIREALSLLTSDNLVERLDQRGFRAAPTNMRNFEEILALRCALEDLALRQSLANRSEEWEDAVVLSHHRMVRAQNNASDDFEDLHKAFHIVILRNCGWPILLKFCSQLYDLNIRYRYLAGGARNYKSRDVTSEHAAILDAVVAGDADRASDCLLNHYRKTGAFLAGMLEELELETGDR